MEQSLGPRFGGSRRSDQSIAVFMIDRKPEPVAYFSVRIQKLNALHLAERRRLQHILFSRVQQTELPGRELGQILDGRRVTRRGRDSFCVERLQPVARAVAF